MADSRVTQGAAGRSDVQIWYLLTPAGGAGLEAMTNHGDTVFYTAATPVAWRRVLLLRSYRWERGQYGWDWYWTEDRG